MIFTSGIYTYLSNYRHIIFIIITLSLVLALFFIMLTFLSIQQAWADWTFYTFFCISTFFMLTFIGGLIFALIKSEIKIWQKCIVFLSPLIGLSFVAISSLIAHTETEHDKHVWPMILGPTGILFIVGGLYPIIPNLGFKLPILLTNWIPFILFTAGLMCISISLISYISMYLSYQSNASLVNVGAFFISLALAFHWSDHKDNPCILIMIGVTFVFFITGLVLALCNNDFGKNAMPFFVSFGFLALVIAGLLILSKALRPLSNEQKSPLAANIPKPASTNTVPSFRA